MYLMFSVIWDNLFEIFSTYNFVLMVDDISSKAYGKYISKTSE